MKLMQHLDWRNGQCVANAVIVTILNVLSFITLIDFK